MERKSKSSKLAKNRPIRERKKLSASEIRDKIEIHKEKNTVAKSKEVKKTATNTKMKNVDDSFVLNPDIQLNDPKDPVTSEKLKSLLKSGAFSFSGKEQSVLAKILKGKS